MQQSIQHFLEDSNQFPGEIPSQFWSGKDSDPDRGSVQSLSARQQRKKREHTAPKLLITVLRQITEQSPKITKFFKGLISQICKSQKNSTAVLIWIIAKKARLINYVNKKFQQQASDKLDSLRRTNQWSLRRFIAATKSKQRTARAFKQKSVNEVFNEIWQGHNHRGKCEDSWEQVLSFQKFINKVKKSKLIRK